MLLLGAVLAGGGPSRFGGDKAMARLGRRHLIDHAIDTLAPQVAQIVVCGREYPPYRSVPDRPRSGLGPLGGLCAALHHASDEGFDAVLALGCDTAYLPLDLAGRLERSAPAVVASAPTIGLWPAEFAPMLERHLLRSSDRSVMHWVRTAGARLEFTRLVLPDIAAAVSRQALEAEIEWEHRLWLSAVTESRPD